MIKQLIILIGIVLLFPAVSAYNLSAGDFQMTGAFTDGGQHLSNGSFILTFSVGQDMIGTLQNSTYILGLGSLTPGEYVPPPAEGPTGGTTGGGGPPGTLGKGCAEGFYKDENGNCIILPESNVTLTPSDAAIQDMDLLVGKILGLGKKIYPASAVVGWSLILMFLGLFIFINKRIFREKEKQKQKKRAEDDRDK